MESVATMEPINEEEAPQKIENKKKGKKNKNNDKGKSKKEDYERLKEKIKPKHKSQKSISKMNAEIELYFNYFIQPSFTFQQEFDLSELLKSHSTNPDPRPFIVGSSSPVLMKKIEYFDIMINVNDF